MDDSCSSSNALKSFGQQLDQDRSRHQDRTRPGASQTNFRSAPPPVSNEASFQAFLAGPSLPQQVAPEMLAGPQPSPLTYSPGFQVPVAAGPHAPIMPMAGPATVPLPMQTPAHAFALPAQAAQWAQEFAGQAPGGPAAAQLHMQFMQQQQQQQQQQQEVMRQQFMSTQMQQSSFEAPVQAQAAPANVGVASVAGVTGMTVDELEARFAQLEADMEFEEEMDQWMAQHGPTETEQQEAARQAGEAEINQMAEALEEQLVGEETHEVEEVHEAHETHDDEAERGDLARTAGHIAEVMAAHDDRRFQSSVFMSLMQRIHAGEVTVAGEDFVDAATGQPLEPETEMGPADEGLPAV